MIRGFTLFEMMIVIALITAGAAVPLFSFVAFQQKNNLQTSFNLVLHSLATAETRAQSGERDLAWGVKIINQRAVVFGGISYISRNPAYDQITDLPASVSITGLDEIYFQKLTGYPNATTTVVFINQRNERKSLVINEKGAFIY